MTRDIAGAFNHLYGSTFVLPEVKIDKRVMTIPGTDGQKMSKSYNNFIDIFLPDKKLRKQIMSINTDSKGLEEVKDPESCNVFSLYKLLATDSQIEEMRSNYLAGNYGYGHAKQALFQVIIDRFSEQRKKFDYYMSNPQEIESELQKGAQKAKVIADEVLARVRSKVGY